MRLPAQRQAARRGRLGSAQPLRPRGGRPGGRAGHRSLPENYNNSIAGQLLPAQLGDRPKTAKAETTFGKVADITHPLFQRYGKDLDSMLAMVPVYRYWPSRQPVEGTHTLLSYADGAPALLERTFKGPKTGRVLLWTTPLSRRPDVGGALRTEPERLERVAVAESAGRSWS